MRLLCGNVQTGGESLDYAWRALSLRRRRQSSGLAEPYAKLRMWRSPRFIMIAVADHQSVANGIN